MDGFQVSTIGPTALHNNIPAVQQQTDEVDFQIWTGQTEFKSGAASQETLSQRPGTADTQRLTV